MELGLRHLRVVLTVHRSGSISSAASTLGLSQPSLSAQLGRIEAALGGALFHRTRTGVVATPLGDDVVHRAQRLVNDFDALLAGAARCAGTSRLTFSVNSTPQWSAFTTGVIQALPEREVVPHTSTSTTVIEELLAQGQVDMALVGFHPVLGEAPLPPHLRQVVVIECEPMLLAMSAHHPLASLAEVPLEALGDDNWLLPPGRPDGTLVALEAAFRQAGIAPASPWGRQRLSDHGPWIAANMGVALALPTYVPYEGVVLRAIEGMPVKGRRSLRWNVATVTEDEARACDRALRESYVELLANTAGRQPWWHEAPAHRPRLAPPVVPAPRTGELVRSR